MNKNYKICVIGAGYVGLPLALQLSKIFKVVLFDKLSSRIQELKSGHDINEEFFKNEINSRKNLSFTNSIQDTKECNVYIICVPTPLKKGNLPNLKYLSDSLKFISKQIKKNDFVISESTVYPGATEEYAKKILEKKNRKLNNYFSLGYSPERINPGDKKHNIQNITKIVSASNLNAIKQIRFIYGSVIRKIYVADNIKTAEAAKIIENTQRDLNVALVNEFSILFNKLKINTSSVLKAASTKWNFLNFKPGLVGGHCIGVDPYYLTYKAKLINYKPKLILAGRNINENMYKYILNKINYFTAKNKIVPKKSKALVIGITFKEDCSDIRNSQYLKIYNGLIKKGFKVDLYDPKVNQKKIKLKLVKQFNKKKYDLIIISFKHKIMKDLDKKFIKKISNANTVIFDLQNKITGIKKDFSL